MAISFKHQLNPEQEPKDNMRANKKRFSTRGWRFVKLFLFITVIIVFYLILFSKIVEPLKEEYVYTKVYRTVKDLRSHPTSTPAIGFVEDEKRLATTTDSELTDRLRGYFLLQVESGGETWYVNPDDGKKYYLGDIDNAIKVLRRLTHTVIDMNIYSYTRFYGESSGKIMVNKRESEKLYYVYPLDNRAYALEEPESFMNITKKFSIGITNADIRKIEVGELDDR